MSLYAPIRPGDDPETAKHLLRLALGEDFSQVRHLRLGQDPLPAEPGEGDTLVWDLDEGEPEHWEGGLFTYSQSRDEAGLTAKNIRVRSSHLEFEAVAVGHIQRIHLPIPGGFTLGHALLCLSCALCLGRTLEGTAPILRCAGGLPGRLEILPVPGMYTVVLDRAGDPRGIERALVSARSFTPGRLVCLPADPSLEEVARQYADQVLPGGERAAVFQALSQAGAGDVILLTGAVAQAREAVEQYLRLARRQSGRHRVSQ